MVEKRIRTANSSESLRCVSVLSGCLVSCRGGIGIIGRIAAAAVSGSEHLDKFASCLGGGGAAVEQLYEPAAYDDTCGV